MPTPCESTTVYVKESPLTGPEVFFSEQYKPRAWPEQGLTITTELRYDDLLIDRLVQLLIGVHRPDPHAEALSAAGDFHAHPVQTYEQHRLAVQLLRPGLAPQASTGGAPPCHCFAGRWHYQRKHWYR